MGDDADDKKMPSMGALVERVVCTVCGEDHRSGEHLFTHKPLMSRDNHKGGEFKVGQVNFLYATIVPAPPCNACGDAMKGVSSAEWACQTEDCDQQGKPLITGVYPVQQIKEDQ